MAKIYSRQEVNNKARELERVAKEEIEPILRKHGVYLCDVGVRVCSAK